MSAPRSLFRKALPIALVAPLIACGERGAEVAAPELAPTLSASTVAQPEPLVTVSSGFGQVDLWPFTGTDFSGTPSDPVNLLFPGADPRALRAALMLLDGNRSAFGFPAAAPFDCTWADAVGANQTAYTAGAGWVGSAIQLECGAFGPIRFHVRLFPAGAWTVANAHFEVLIPGTNQHEVLSWELAEQLVTADFVRSGLLDAGAPMATTGAINPAPSFRTINPLVYNGLPEALRVALTGSPAAAAAPVPVATDGRATVLNLAAAPEGEAGTLQNDFTVVFDQVIPKPFCASGPFDYLHVRGPIAFRQRIAVTPSGHYVSQFHAQGALTLTPVNPLTSPPAPIGDSYEARVIEHYRNIVTDRHSLVSNFQMRVLLPANAPLRGHLLAHLSVGPGGSSRHSLSIECN